MPLTIIESTKWYVILIFMDACPGVDCTVYLCSYSGAGGNQRIRKFGQWVVAYVAVITFVVTG